MSDWKWMFLEALTEIPNVARAARLAEVDRTTAYKARAVDPEFAEAWDHALGVSVDALEAEAFRRAKDGTLKPVFHMGQACGAIREYSDTLAIFLLKAHKPEYRERQAVELSGRVETVSRKPDFSGVSDDELDVIIRVTNRMRLAERSDDGPSGGGR